MPMNTEHGYLSAALLRPLLESVSDTVYENIPANQLELIHNLNKQLRDPNGYIAGNVANEVINLLVRYSGKEDLCVQSASKFNIQSSCQLQHLFLCCSNLREALYYLEKFATLLADGLDLQITRTRDNIIKLKLPVRDNFIVSTERHRTEVAISVFLNWMRQLCGSQLDILKISLPYPSTQYAAIYEQHWQSAIEFNSDECTIQFHNKWLDIGLHNTNPHILNMMKREVEEQYRKLARSGSLAERIYKALTLRKIRLNANQQEVAEYFHISARTLNRHLNQEGTSLKQLVTKVRIELAHELLTTSNEGIEQIAIGLGLSGRRTLDRIFIKEMGMSPAQLRQNHRHSKDVLVQKIANSN